MDHVQIDAPVFPLALINTRQQKPVQSYTLFLYPCIVTVNADKYIIIAPVEQG